LDFSIFSIDVPQVDLLTILGFLRKFHLFNGKDIKNRRKGPNKQCKETEVSKLFDVIFQYSEQCQSKSQNGDVRGISETITVVNQVVTLLNRSREVVHDCHVRDLHGSPTNVEEPGESDVPGLLLSLCEVP
jgi:hypothetical protein